MLNEIIVNDKKYVLVNFKSPSFSLQQGLKLSELVQNLLEIPSLASTLEAFIAWTTDGADTVFPWARIISAVLGAKDLFKREELPQIFFLLYLPEGVKYNEEYENTLAQRAQSGKYEIPLIAIIEGLTSFFASRTTAAESLTGGSTEAPQVPQATL